MANVVSLTKHRQAAKKKKAQGKTLCSRGFHRWEIDRNKQFDVKRGKLVTVERCSRCGATRSKAT